MRGITACHPCLPGPGRPQRCPEPRGRGREQLHCALRGQRRAEPPRQGPVCTQRSCARAPPRRGPAPPRWPRPSRNRKRRRARPLGARLLGSRRVGDSSGDRVAAQVGRGPAAGHGGAEGLRGWGRLPAQLQRAAVGAAGPLPRHAADGLALPVGGGHPAPAQPRRGHVQPLRECLGAGAGARRGRGRRGGARVPGGWGGGAQGEGTGAWDAGVTGREGDPEVWALAVPAGKTAASGSPGARGPGCPHNASCDVLGNGGSVWTTPRGGELCAVRPTGGTPGGSLPAVLRFCQLRCPMSVVGVSRGFFVGLLHPHPRGWHLPRSVHAPRPPVWTTPTSICVSSTDLFPEPQTPGCPLGSPRASHTRHIQDGLWPSPLKPAPLTASPSLLG